MGLFFFFFFHLWNSNNLLCVWRKMFQVRPAPVGSHNGCLVTCTKGSDTPRFRFSLQKFVLRSWINWITDFATVPRPSQRSAWLRDRIGVGTDGRRCTWLRAGVPGSGIRGRMADLPNSFPSFGQGIWWCPCESSWTKRSARRPNWAAETWHVDHPTKARSH